MTGPRISVVTPSYNQGAYLERTICSVLDQGYPDLEYIVVDGGSTDQSLAVIEKYRRHLAYWVSEPDGGQGEALNRGLARATGQLLAWINSDDWYRPRAFEIIADAARAHPDKDAFVGRGDMVGEDGALLWQVTPPPTVTLETLYNWLVGGSDFAQPSCFFRDTAWRRAGPIDTRVHIAFDVDLWFRMVTAGCAFHTLDAVLSSALVHRGAKTTAYSYLTFVDFSIVAMRYGGETAARAILEDFAVRLSWAEPNLEKILRHPLLRLIEPIAGFFFKPAVRKRNVKPRWMRDGAASAGATVARPSSRGEARPALDPP